MTDTPAEWVEMAWAAREAAHVAMNAERSQRFAAVKHLILEADLPASKINRDSAFNISTIKQARRA